MKLTYSIFNYSKPKIETFTETTAAPTTAAPTTAAPTTAAPQTVAPQTVAPQTVAPQTVAPQTVALTTAEPQTVAPTTQAPYVAIASDITQSPYSIVPTNTSKDTLVFDDILYYVEKIDTISEDLEEELDINLSTHDLNLIVANESDINDFITNIKDNNIPYIFNPKNNTYYIYSEDLTTTNENFTQQAPALQKPKVIIIKKKNIILPSNKQNCMQNTYYMHQIFTIMLLFVLIFIILRVTQQTSFSSY